MLNREATLAGISKGKDALAELCISLAQHDATRKMVAFFSAYAQKIVTLTQNAWHKMQTVYSQKTALHVLARTKGALNRAKYTIGQHKRTQQARAYAAVAARKTRDVAQQINRDNIRVLALRAKTTAEAHIETIRQHERTQQAQIALRAYFGRMSGVTQSQPRAPISDIAWSWLGGFLGLAVVAYFSAKMTSVHTDMVYIIGSFGASAVLIYGTPKAPFAQPRNLVGGHMVSAFVGVSCYALLPDPLWLSAAVAVATAIAAMHITRTIHPPGGATALIAVIGSAKIHSMGYLYVFIPVGLGALLLLLVALLVNNLNKDRQYPQFWV